MCLVIVLIVPFYCTCTLLFRYPSGLDRERNAPVGSVIYKGFALAKKKSLVVFWKVLKYRNTEMFSVFGSVQTSMAMCSRRSFDIQGFGAITAKENGTSASSDT